MDRNHRLTSLLATLLLALLISSAAALAADSQRDPDQLRAQHVLNRLAFGPSEPDLKHVLAIGVDAYVEEQLHPAKLSDPPELADRLSRFETQKLSTSQLYARWGRPADQSQASRLVASIGEKRIDFEAKEAKLLRAAYGPAQLREMLVDFWFNHFNIGGNKIWLGSYEREAIRPFVLGHFRDLLKATAHHTAMLVYLNNEQSSVVMAGNDGKPRGGLNENYAREVMELHTLGVDGGYTQKDVTELARILTGWRYSPVSLRDGVEPAFAFVASRHDSGAKRFLGQDFPAGHGLDEGERALDILASSPATAHHIAWQLAQFFVADDPPKALVDRLAERFRKTDGDIEQMLELLFKSPEFWDADNVGNKFKTPFQYVVSTLRLTAPPMVVSTRPLFSVLEQNGQPLYGCATPDGYADTRAAWLSPNTLLYRLHWASLLGSGFVPLWRAPPAIEPSAAGMQASSARTGDAMSMQSQAGAQEAADTQRVKAVLPDAERMRAMLGGLLSARTLTVVDATPAPQKAAAILGSPDFMKR